MSRPFLCSFRAQADDAAVCCCGKAKAYHYDIVMMFGAALGDVRVLNGTHEIIAEYTGGPVAIRKSGSTWNARHLAGGLVGQWSPVRHIAIETLCWNAAIVPVDFAAERRAALAAAGGEVDRG